jgi:predicted Zn-dependent protease
MNISIYDISNGFLVRVYNGDSLSKESYTKFFETWEEALAEVIKWAKEQNLPAYFKGEDLGNA